MLAKKKVKLMAIAIFLVLVTVPANVFYVTLHDSSGWQEEVLALLSLFTKFTLGLLAGIIFILAPKAALLLVIPVFLLRYFRPDLFGRLVIWCKGAFYLAIRILDWLL